MLARLFANRPLAVTCGYALLWALLWLDWTAWYQLPVWLQAVGFTASIGFVWYWHQWSCGRGVIVRRAVLSAAFVPVWQWIVFATHGAGLDELRVMAARAGLGGAFLIGLAWVVWYVERTAQQYRAMRRAAAVAAASPRDVWNPLDLDAWYYGRRQPRLNQSLATLAAYALLFTLLFMLLNELAGCREIYEMPAGGGERKQLQQVVKIEKIIQRKFIINPFSSVIFNPPPIDEVKLQLLELTKHAYQVGYGQGEGAGFAGGTKRGKVRFIRLEYAGGDWDQDFGVGADLNMLIEYGARTGHQVADQTESRQIGQLANFPAGKSPPVVYMTGQRNISLSNSEVKVLREFLLDKHGMIFADNGGSGHWHNQFFSVMRQVLPRVEPVRVPLDDVIHRVPYAIPFVPYVAPHGGKEAWGWKVDGRWVVYYHPGDIGDAWADGHAGVRREIWEACYQLGVNVIFYAHAEYNKWLDARTADEDEAGK